MLDASIADWLTTISSSLESSVDEATEIPSGALASHSKPLVADVERVEEEICNETSKSTIVSDSFANNTY